MINFYSGIFTISEAPVVGANLVLRDAYMSGITDILYEEEGVCSFTVAEHSNIINGTATCTDPNKGLVLERVNSTKIKMSCYIKGALSNLTQWDAINIILITE